MTLQALIRTLTKSTPPSDIDELVLDEWRGVELTPEDRTLLEALPGLQFLSFNGCGLKSLKGFPGLPQLLKLDLNDNKLPGGFQPLAGAPRLVKLSLAGNPIKSLDDLKPLVNPIQTSLKALVELDLFNCPVSKVAGYREAIFKLLPGLQLLDRINQQGEEMSESDSECLDEDFDDEEDSESAEDESEGEDLDAMEAPAAGTSEANCTLIEDSEDSEEDPEPVKKRRS